MHMCTMKPLTTGITVVSVAYFLIQFLLSFFPLHITVVELSAEIATLQTAVLNTRRELKHSMKDKRILQEKATAAQLDKVAD